MFEVATCLTHYSPGRAAVWPDSGGVEYYTHPVGISSPKQNSDKKGYAMGENKIIALKKPGEFSEDLILP